MSKNEKDLKDFIIESIERTGFTLEQYVTNLLAKEGWMVFPGSHYHDKDLDKDREIDIFAQKEIFSKENKVLCKFFLVIECKKIPGNGWIFFPAPEINDLYRLHIPQFYTLIDAFNKKTEALPISLMLLSKKGYFSCGYTEIIIDKDFSNKKDDNLFEAIVSVTKATSAQKDTFLESTEVSGILSQLKNGKTLEWWKNGCPMSICFVFPIITFEGSMYSAGFPLNKDSLNEANLIHYYGEYNSGRYQENTCIDIVKKEKLGEYFHLLNDEIDLIASRNGTDKLFKDYIIQNIKPK